MKTRIAAFLKLEVKTLVAEVRRTDRTPSWSNALWHQDNYIRTIVLHAKPSLQIKRAETFIVRIEFNFRTLREILLLS